MRGEIKEIEKESFWREHQDTLVRIRDDLASGKKSRAKFSPAGGIRKRTPNGPTPLKKLSDHPPYGKYRRTPSPYLPKLSPQPDLLLTSAIQNAELRARNLEVVPPVKPKIAFGKNDYDSWGEESEEDDDSEEDEEYKENNYKQKRSDKRRGKGRQFKPQPYPSPMPGYGAPPVVYGAPFPVYYPPPPQGARRKKKQYGKKNHGYKDIYHAHQAYASHPVAPMRKKDKRKGQIHHSMPMYATPMIPAMPMMYPPPQEVDEDEDDDSEEDEMIKRAYVHFKNHPLFAEDFAKWFLNDFLDTDFFPDFLIQTLNEIKHMPYDHPMYLPSLYACEDVMGDGLSEIIADLVREAVKEVTNDYIDEERLKRDPLEDFLSDLIDDAVRGATRDAIGSAVVDMAQDYLESEVANGIFASLVADHVDDIASDLLEDTLFEIVAEDFIETEVIEAELKEESEVVATEMIQHYDDKIMRKEFKEVWRQAKDKLADTVMMEYVLSLMSQQGKLWTEEDHHNKHLDDIILNMSIGQMFNIQQRRDKTVESKPLHKLHEKVVSDVALDVFLQQLTQSLDEDMADVDEYERGVNNDVYTSNQLVVR